MGVSRRFEESLVKAQEAIELFRAMRHQPGEVAGLNLTAEVHMFSKNVTKASETANTALTLATTCGDTAGAERSNALLKKIEASKKKAAESDSDSDSDENEDSEYEEVASGPAGLKTAEVERMVQALAQSTVGSSDAIDMEAALMDMGMDSLSSVAFR